jgi:protein gp37
MENTKIEWATHTFNPWIGCTKVSPGCLNCYAETLMAVRYGKVEWGKGKPRVRTAPDNWRKPRQWNKAAAGAAERPRVFCASLADWLDEEVPIQWLADLLGLIRDTPNLDWLLLTKRPENFADRLNLARKKNGTYPLAWEEWLCEWLDGIAPPNVWVGTSVEDQARSDRRIPELLQIPATVRFLSCEPLLEDVDLCFGFEAELDARRIDWVICGGESGRGARLMHEDWALSLRDQCTAAGVPFHFKQWGGSDKKAAGRVLDGRTWDELPAPRVQEIA